MKWACSPLPSVTARSAIDTFGAMPAVFESVTVPVAVAVVMVAPEGLDSVTVKVSLASTAVSARMGTLICWEITPGAKVSVPVVAVKSDPAVAVPLVVA